MSSEDNELLTRVENGAPMGEMLRNNYWFPAIIAQTLIPGGNPMPVRLLGENLVAFRSNDGRVGIFDEHCPHRRASLLLARNEDNALRCIYHGWKFGVDGEVLEVPTEPNDPAAFCKNVPLRSYPTREAAGIVWIWMGRGEPMRWPDFEFMNVPEGRVHTVHQRVRCNWVQDVEGGLDSAHVSILHSHWLRDVGIGDAGVDVAPTYEFDMQNSGYCYAALRKLRDGTFYTRVTQFVMPWYAFIAPEEMPEGDRLVIFSTPVDDTNTVHWMLRYNRVRTLKPSYVNPVDDPSNFPPAAPGNRDTVWGQDRDAMRRGHFSGFHHINTEDFAVAESQGPIADRSKEYLNSGDRAVVQFRKQLLQTAKEYAAGKKMSLAQHDEINYAEARAAAFILRPGEDWHAAYRDKGQAA